MDILLIKPYWTDKIFLNDKCWEIRGSNTKKRGIIGIAKSGTGQVFGTVRLFDSISLTKELWECNRDKHQVELSWEELLKIYKYPYAWVLTEKNQYAEPIPYNHPQGAVIWVKTDIEPPVTLENDYER